QSPGQALWIASVPGGNPGEIGGKRVGHLDLTARFVAAADVAHPARYSEAEKLDRASCGEIVAHRGEQALRQFLRAVHRDLLRAVRQGGIAEAFDQCLLVRDDIDTRG